jgi:hypothetical protein
MAKARLRERHQRMLKDKLMQLKQEVSVINWAKISTGKQVNCSCQMFIFSCFHEVLALVTLLNHNVLLLFLPLKKYRNQEWVIHQVKFHSLNLDQNQR